MFRPHSLRATKENQRRKNKLRFFSLPLDFRSKFPVADLSRNPATPTAIARFESPVNGVCLCDGVLNWSMRMRSERSKPLHNFMLPCLKWGNQRHLRCMKVNSNGVQVSGVNRQSHSSRSEESTESRVRESASEMRMFLKDLEMRPKVSKSRIKKTDDDDDDGIEAVREKLMFDLKTAADKMKQAILSKEAAVVGEEAEEKRNDSAGMEETPAADARPWNLRTRRAACKAPNVDGGGSKNLKIDEKKSNSDSPSPRLKIGPEKKKKAKLVVPLSKREIDEDFMEMLGHKPPKRPKKRTRVVQKQLDMLFPGLWISEITADMYKVPELPENGKVMKV